MRRTTRFAALAAVLTSLLFLAAGPSYADDGSLRQGAVLVLTREAVLNGVTLTKGSEIKVVAVQRDAAGAVVRVDVEQVGGERKVFKGLTLDAVAAMTGASKSTSPNGDRAQVLKAGAQIPIMRDFVVQGITVTKATVLSVDRVQKDGAGKIVKIDLRETTGAHRLIKGVAVEQFLLALSPDDVTWPDGVVGATIEVAGDLVLGGTTFSKGTKLVVTKVVNAPGGGGVVKVDLREIAGDKRTASDVSVAILKQNGALGTAGRGGK
jgi:hypothetical protein